VLNSRVSALYLRSTTIITRLTEHDDVIQSLFRGAPRLGLALGPSPARAGPDYRFYCNLGYEVVTVETQVKWFKLQELTR